MSRILCKRNCLLLRMGVAQLHVGLGEHGFNGFREPLQSVDAGDLFLLAVHVDAQRQVHRLGPHGTRIAHLHMDATQVGRWDTAYPAASTAMP